MTRPTRLLLFLLALLCVQARSSWAVDCCHFESSRTTVDPYGPNGTQLSTDFCLNSDACFCLYDFPGSGTITHYYSCQSGSNCAPSDPQCGDAKITTKVCPGSGDPDIHCYDSSDPNNACTLECLALPYYKFLDCWYFTTKCTCGTCGASDSMTCDPTANLVLASSQPKVDKPAKPVASFPLFY